MKVVNNSTSPNSLNLILLVFSAFLRITKLDDSAPTILQRATIVRKVIEEITKLRAKL